MASSCLTIRRTENLFLLHTFFQLRMILLSEIRHSNDPHKFPLEEYCFMRLRRSRTRRAQQHSALESLSFRFIPKITQLFIHRWRGANDIMSTLAWWTCKSINVGHANRKTTQSSLSTFVGQSNEHITERWTCQDYLVTSGSNYNCTQLEKWNAKTSRAYNYDNMTTMLFGCSALNI